MKRFATIGISLLCLGLSAAAMAEEKLTIKQKDQRNADLEMMKEQTNNADAYCATKLEADIDWSTFKGVDPGEHSLSGYCGEPFGAMGSLCNSSANAKAEIKKSVKKVVCAYGGKGKRSVGLKDGTLTWKIDWDAVDNGDFLKAWLQDNL